MRTSTGRSNWSSTTPSRSPTDRLQDIKFAAARSSASDSRPSRGVVAPLQASNRRRPPPPPPRRRAESSAANWPREPSCSRRQLRPPHIANVQQLESAVQRCRRRETWRGWSRPCARRGWREARGRGEPRRNNAFLRADARRFARSRTTAAKIRPASCPPRARRLVGTLRPRPLFPVSWTRRRLRSSSDAAVPSRGHASPRSMFPPWPRDVREPFPDLDDAVRSRRSLASGPSRGCAPAAAPRASVGGGFLALQGLQYNGYVAVDWRKVQRDALRAGGDRPRTTLSPAAAGVGARAGPSPETWPRDARRSRTR